MISNERPSPYHLRQPYQPKPAMEEDTLAIKELQVERKSFTFRLKNNARGRFMRITEAAGTKYDNIMIPASGLEEFAKVLAEMVKASNELPEVPPK